MTADAGSGQAQICSDDSGILRRTLRVRAVEGGDVTLEGHRASACAGCAARTGCGAGALAEMLGASQTLRLPRTIPVQAGDRVVVAMDRRAFLGAAMRAYLLPPVALAATAGAAHMLDLSDLMSALLCLPALILAFLPLLRADRRALHAHGLWLEPASDG